MPPPWCGTKLVGAVRLPTRQNVRGENQRVHIGFPQASIRAMLACPTHCELIDKEVAGTTAARLKLDSNRPPKWEKTLLAG